MTVIPKGGWAAVEGWALALARTGNTCQSPCFSAITSHLSNYLKTVEGEARLAEELERATPLEASSLLLRFKGTETARQLDALIPDELEQQLRRETLALQQLIEGGMGLFPYGISGGQSLKVAPSCLSNSGWPHLAAAQDRSLIILRQWTETALRIGEHLQPDDSRQAVAALVPLLQEQGKTHLADAFESMGPCALFEVGPAERRAMINGLVPLLSPSAQLTLQNDVIALTDSEGRIRPLKLMTQGVLSKPNPEIFSLLNREFKYSGRAFLLEQPFGGAQDSPHLIYFPQDKTLDWHPHGYSPISVYEPLILGLLRIGGLRAADLEKILSAQAAPAAVDVLMVSGVLTYDTIRLTELLRWSGASLIVTRSQDQTIVMNLNQVENSHVVFLGPATETYTCLKFDPIEMQLRLSLHQTHTGNLLFEEIIALATAGS